MIYKDIKKAKFISRPNRFIANIEIDGKTEICHVKNTGRCKELLIKDSDIFVQEHDSVKRKTKYDLISVYKGDKIVNIDSQATNKVVHEWIKEGNLFDNVSLIKPESKYKNSRFDFYVEADNRKIYIEVKGVTLEENGIVMFPDAPTERGVKHLKELAECLEEGFDAYVIFIIQMSGVKLFKPNKKTHKEFAEILKEVSNKGVTVLAYECLVSENSMNIYKAVPVRV